SLGALLSTAGTTAATGACNVPAPDVFAMPTQLITFCTRPLDFGNTPRMCKLGFSRWAKMVGRIARVGREKDWHWNIQKGESL
ncbi:MAG TPA: hypothetical protein PLC58_11550, partial [Denitromonas sp.]|nr:hypothetical protein [Denitromonas sp.]